MVPTDLSDRNESQIDTRMEVFYSTTGRLNGHDFLDLLELATPSDCRRAFRECNRPVKP